MPAQIRASRFAGPCEGPFKKDCYATIGEMVVPLFDDKGKRAQACRKGEDEYVDACLASATAF